MVNNTKTVSIKNSLLFKSGKYSSQYLLDVAPANTILLNIKIVYAAENTIDDEAKTPARGNLSKIPYKDMNSPTKFNVKGAPQLPKDKIKNKIENIGII